MEEIGQLVAGVDELVRAYGAAAVLVIVMLEAFGLPLPGESLLIFSAALAGRGEMPLPCCSAPGPGPSSATTSVT